MEIKLIQQKAQKIRIDIIKMIAEAGSGHPAGSLGMADIFAALYFSILKHNPKKPDWPERDRLILSCGHIAPVWYATLALAGYFSTDKLTTLRKLGSKLEGHPIRHSLPGIENTSGSLGQGLSVAVGLSLAAKMNHQNHHIYLISSDGEHQEGQSWEAIMSASHYRLDNLINIVDRNNIQSSGQTEKIMALEPLAAKYSAFGWQVYEINGHNIGQIIKVCQKCQWVNGQPKVIIAKTVAGKGVDFMEGKSEWHSRAPDCQEVEQALDELSK